MKIRSVTSVKVYLFCLLLPALFLTLPLRANNVSMEGAVKVTDVTGSMATLEINLIWDNSWCDTYNWDAVWVFLKYRKDGLWKHVDLAETGHDLSPANVSNSYGYMAGTTNGKVKGLFIRRSERGGGQSAVVCRLKWPLPAGVTAESFDKSEVFLIAQGIEMVYIPYGAYRLGDGASEKSFKDGDNHPYVIDSEEACTLSDDGNTTVALEADYPKGFRGFYVMKYEVSQEQYVTFLNTLTRTQQNELLPGVVDKTRGQYVFGDGMEPLDRNGIIVAQNLTGEPLVFDNNLTNDGDFGQDDDGQNVACNYMCVRDLLAYSAWAGLRPMSEPEYEKACRKPYPVNVTANEYAWNSAADLVQAATLQDEGTPGEYPSVGNVNINNGIAGPVRCGAFAAASGSNPDQVKAGATYWGVMEMSGNLRELCASVQANGVLSGEKYGNGEYNLALWGSTPTHFGLRGGGFDSPQARASVSDRAEMAAITDVADRTSAAKSIGFRCVRSLEESVILRPGAIQPAADTVCPKVTTIKINNITEASVNENPDLPITYAWYVNHTLIENEQDSSLTYTIPENNGTQPVEYTFKRRGICALGEGVTAEVKVTTLPAPAFKLDTTTVTIQMDGTAGTVKATAAVEAELEYTWKYNGTAVHTGAAYQPDRTTFGSTGGTYTVVCEANVKGCPDGTAGKNVTVRDVVLNPGEIALPDGAATTLCADGGSVTINNKTAATVSVGDAPAYKWYVNNAEIAGATGADLTHALQANTTTAPVTYTFEREAVVSEGSKRTGAISVTVLPQPQFSIDPTTVTMSTSDAVGSQTVTATAGVSGTGVELTYVWKYGETILSTEATYQPDPASFSADGGTFDVICIATLSGCTQVDTQTLQLTVSVPVSLCGYDFTDTRPEGNNEVYPTVQIGDQCWMAKNMNVGTKVDGTDYNTHTTAGIQKICYENNEANCDTYGGLYRWEEVVNGENVSAAADQPNYKYVSGSSGPIQGICPDGWHVPSDEEWKTLELSLGMDASVVGNTGWRGTDQGCQLKSTDYWTTHSGTTGTNSSKMNMRPGGDRFGSNGHFNGLGSNGYWWTSSLDGSYAWCRTLYYFRADVYRSAPDKSLGYSVRCVRESKKVDVVLTPGEIALPDGAATTLCADGGSVTINNTTAATAVEGNTIAYKWYVNNAEIAGATGADLTHALPANTTTAPVTYTFEREAVVAHGSVFTAAISVTVLPQPQFTISPTTVSMQTSDAVGSKMVTATAGVSGTGVSLTYQWKYGETILSTEATYQPDPKSFNTAVGTYDVICTATLSGCTQTASQTLKVTVQDCGSDFIDTRPEGNNEVYPTVQIGDQCWMAKNMNMGTREPPLSSTTKFKKVCYENNERNCDIYGGLYSWAIAMSGIEYTGLIDPKDYKYVSGSTTMIQGICPDGWHIPSDEEWKTLEMALGMTQADADIEEDFRGTDQGTQLKSTDLWPEVFKGTNSSGMNILPGGAWNAFDINDWISLDQDGMYWTSTPNGETAWFRGITYYPDVFRGNLNQTAYASVRCVKN